MTNQNNSNLGSSFKAAYPLQLNFYNQNTENVLYLDATPSPTITVQLTNISQNTISLPTLASTGASSSNCHFQLIFRPGTLDSTCLSTISVSSQDNWNIKADTLSNGCQVLYLGYKTETTIDPNNMISISINNLKANPIGGSRSTNVELVCSKVTYKGNTTLINGNRTQYLTIINHFGSSEVPLHAGVIGSNVVVNDGYTASTLQLKISRAFHLPQNTDVTLSGTSTSTPSTLYFSFEIEPSSNDVPWAIATEDQVSAFELKYNNGSYNIIPNAGSNKTEWKLTFDSNLTLTNNPGDYIDILISNILTTLPAGPANLYIRYENVPGYWDGTLICELQKSPTRINSNYTINSSSTDNPEPLVTMSAQGYAEPLLRVESDKGVSIQANVKGTSQASIQLTNEATLNQIANQTYYNSWFLANTSSGLFNLQYGTNQKSTAIMSTTPNVDPSKTLTTFSGQVKIEEELSTAQNISAGQKIQESGADLIPKGSIIMWSGDASDCPAGWAVCDGKNGTPDLSDRFIVSAGTSHKANTSAEADTHSHSVAIPEQSLTTSKNGDHTHEVTFPTTTSMSSGDTSNYNLCFNSSQTSTKEGAHTHSVSINASTITSSTQTGLRPRWYALTFIVKL